MPKPPILENKHFASPSVFSPSALLREARRQRGLPQQPVPDVCILDPDGDLVSRLRKGGRIRRFEPWACYHTELDSFSLAGRDVGLVGRAIGASFAVLIAEELFASGCNLLISLTSAGQIEPAGTPPYFVIIDRALRDEGTSYHYTSPGRFAQGDETLIREAASALADGPRTIVGASWTTDAPFRETLAAIEAARAEGILCVEMEASALYTFGSAVGVRVLCLAHVTNTMGQSGDDFDKGIADGTLDALTVLGNIVEKLVPSR